MGVPENIDALLTKYDINQEGLSRIAGVAPSAVSRWRKGAMPRMTAIKAICDYFNLAEDDILSDAAGLAAKEHGRYSQPEPLPPNALPVRAVPTAKVPLVGSTHAGTAALSDEFDEFPDVEIPKFLVDRDPGSYGLEVEGDCMDRVCPAGMVAVVQPHVEPKSGDVVVAVIDGAMSLMRRMTVINGALILSPESHNPEHENIYIPPDDERSVHVEHVAYFQSRCMF